MGVGEHKQGEHCRLCRARGEYEFRVKENMKIVEEIKDTSGLLTNEQIGEMLTKTEGIEQWIKDLKSSGLEKLLKGENIKGWKAVEGRSVRKIVDVDKAFDILEANGFDEAILYERKPITLTQLEKVVGKTKLVEAIGDYIEKPKGAPTLAKESDKREVYRMSAADEFKESEEN